MFMSFMRRLMNRFRHMFRKRHRYRYGRLKIIQKPSERKAENK